MIEIHDCEQNSPEWRAVRAGKPTASEFKTVLASGKDGGASATRKTYMLKLAGEIITGEPAEHYASKDMERGHEQEPEARDLYALLHDVEPIRVGFITNGRKGCSPDSLIGDDGGLEIKSAAAHIQIERLLRNDLPPEHKAQVQGTLLVTERVYWDFMSYCPKCPPLIVRVYRDESYLKALQAEIDRFTAELDELVERVRAYGGVQHAA